MPDPLTDADLEAIAARHAAASPGPWTYQRWAAHADIPALLAEVRRLRAAIRNHRDQRGDDRCWLDDSQLYGVLPEGAAYDSSLPPKCEFLASCERYFEQRQSPAAKDLQPNKMTIAQLEAEVRRLRVDRDGLLAQLAEADELLGYARARGVQFPEKGPSREELKARYKERTGKAWPGLHPDFLARYPLPDNLGQLAVCVAVVVEDDRGVLLLRRSATSTFPGTWCLPGGHVADGEPVGLCCHRELEEETGISASEFSFEALTEVLGPPHLIGLVYRALRVEGHFRNAEPDKHDYGGWFPRDKFPSPLMPGVVQWLENTARDDAPGQSLSKSCVGSHAVPDNLGQLVANLRRAAAGDPEIDAAFVLARAADLIERRFHGDLIK